MQTAQLAPSAVSHLLHLPVRKHLCRTRTTLQCQASCGHNVSRRAAAAAAVLAPSLLLAKQAWALIPANDDEDEELVEKAKANRSSRIKQERNTEQRFAQSEGYTDNTVQTLQRAIKKLAKSGSQLESGDLQAVAAGLRDPWVGEFKKATETVNSSQKAKDAAQRVFTSLSQVGSSAGGGDAAGAKRNFVSVVTAFQEWGKDTGVIGRLSGL